MISIVIPAHNEEAVIGRCLRSLTHGARPGELEIIVACNGCTDRTAEIASQFAPWVRVVVAERASKIAALNLGDENARGFPRCYIDADIEVGINEVRQVAGLLQRGTVLAAAPAMRVDLSRSSLLVRAFYTIWLRQSYHGPGMVGGGFYGLSETGRKRFDRFPEIIADDEFVRRHFDPNERATPPDCYFTIRAPRTLAQLIKIKTRSRLGLYQLAKRFPTRPAPRGTRRHTPWILQPWLWPAGAVYGLVNIITRLRAAQKLSTIAVYQWERDESSRELPVSSAS